MYFLRQLQVYKFVDVYLRIKFEKRSIGLEESTNKFSKAYLQALLLFTQDSSEISGICNRITIQISILGLLKEYKLFFSLFLQRE